MLLVDLTRSQPRVSTGSILPAAARYRLKRAPQGTVTAKTRLLSWCNQPNARIQGPSVSYLVVPLVGRWFAVSYLAPILEITHTFDCFFGWPTYPVASGSFYFSFHLSFFIFHFSFFMLHIVFCSVFFLCPSGFPFSPFSYFNANIESLAGAF